MEVRNRFAGTSYVAADELVSTDALALVRFGLRAADDPRIIDTVKVIDHVLRVDLPYGPGWRRYNGDGYGEHDDGRPYDGTGVGRVWPLLAGERAHYELAAGRRAEAETAAGGDGGRRQPRQAAPRAGVGRPTDPGARTGAGQAERFGHAAGLGARRAHQAAALAGGRGGVRPAAATGRGATCARSGPHAAGPGGRTGGTPNVPVGRALRLDLLEPALVHWSADGWQTRSDARTRDTGLGIHTAEISTAGLVPGRSIVFTWLDLATETWIGQDYAVAVTET